MTSAFAGVFFAYLLSVSFTDSLQVNTSPVSKLVDYSYILPHQGLIPALGYNGSIQATWAVPNSALAGLEGKTLTVHVAAQTENSSVVSFPTQFGVQSESYDAYLVCIVSEGKCANSSTLSAEIPLTVQSAPGISALSNITLRSELMESDSAAAIGQSAGGLLDSLTGMFYGNGSATAVPNGSNANASGIAGAQGGNFLDSLKPEGNSQDPIAFLKENPIISLAALGIVVVITGAYLLNAND